MANSNFSPFVPYFFLKKNFIILLHISTCTRQASIYLEKPDYPSTLQNFPTIMSHLASPSEAVPPAPSPDDIADYNCTCRTPDLSESWICCDNDACPVGWYHWECARVTEEPPRGAWYCPTCCRETSPASSSGTVQPQRRRRGAKMSEMAASHGKTRRDAGECSDRTAKVGKGGPAERPRKKGTAVKKATPKKGKSKWVGWREVGF